MSDTISLHMGFINTPYIKETIARPMTSAKIESKRKRRRGFSKTMTAEKVANILEGKYGIVETFSAVYEEEISNIMTEGFAEIARNMLSSGRTSTTSSIKNLMKPSTNNIQSLFRSFLDQEEMNGMVEGVPTAAALGGKRSGRGSKTRKGIKRPSFINTGIYRASFRCWADNK
jgi:hypothetical protein